VSLSDHDGVPWSRDGVDGQAGGNRPNVVDANGWAFGDDGDGVMHRHRSFFQYFFDPMIAAIASDNKSMHTLSISYQIVIPAKAGIYLFWLDPRLRGDDN
jgi:hypothetical protein